MLTQKTKNRFKARIFKALADPARLEILEFLRSGEKCVCEIIPHVQLAQPLVSRHLKVLRNCGIVKFRKEGNKRLYSITDPQIFRLIDRVDQELMECFVSKMIEQMT